jgi:hypothetical protein
MHQNGNDMNIWHCLKTSGCGIEYILENITHKNTYVYFKFRRSGLSFLTFICHIHALLWCTPTLINFRRPMTDTTLWKLDLKMQYILRKIQNNMQVCSIIGTAWCMGHPYCAFGIHYETHRNLNLKCMNFWQILWIKWFYLLHCSVDSSKRWLFLCMEAASTSM